MTKNLYIATMCSTCKVNKESKWFYFEQSWPAWEADRSPINLSHNGSQCDCKCDIMGCDVSTKFNQKKLKFYLTQ